MHADQHEMTGPATEDRQDRRFGRYLLVVLSVYVILIGARITTTHTGMIFGTQDERSNVILGSPRPERSDEFLRGSPLLIASIRETSFEERTPLELTNSLQDESDRFGLRSISEWLVTPDQLLVRILVSLLPLEFAFASVWWSSHLLLFVALPLWFKLLGGRLRSAVLTCVAISFCPPSAWFSYLPLLLTANAAAGISFFLLCFKVADSDIRHRWAKVGAVVALATLAARFVFTTIQYPPWGIPIFLVCAGISSGWFFENRLLLKRIWIWLVAAGAGIGFALLTFLANRELYKATLATVYPGQRRSIGASADAPFLGGSLSWIMETNFARTRGFTNPEFAFGPTVLLVAVLGLLLLLLLTKSSIRSGVGTAVGLAITCFVILWGQVTWPEALRTFNPLVLVPGSRATMIVSVLALILLGHAVSTHSYTLPQNIKKSALLAVGLSFGLFGAVWTASDVEWLRANYYVGIEPWKGFVSITVASSLVAFYVASRFRQTIHLLTVMMIVLSTILVNPWTIGLGALNHSEAMTTVQRISESNPSGRWATTGFYVDALMVSAGVPQLSGQQFGAPNRPAWAVLDPDNQFEENWNRGQSYINFQLAPSQTFSIWNPSPDVIQVVGDPCDPRFSNAGLRFLISEQFYNTKCSRVVATITWIGNEYYIHQIEAS